MNDLFPFQRKQVEYVEMRIVSLLRLFCNSLKEGRPDSSNATISPSTTVSSGRLESADTIEGNRREKSFPLRERRGAFPPLLSPRARYPSNSNLVLPLRTSGENRRRKGQHWPYEVSLRRHLSDDSSCPAGSSRGIASIGALAETSLVLTVF